MYSINVTMKWWHLVRFCKWDSLHSLVKEGQDIVVDEDMSLDGTWQKKDHSSKNDAVMSCQNHVRVAKHSQNDRTIQTITNGKITTTVISTIQNHQVPWKQLVQGQFSKDGWIEINWDIWHGWWLLNHKEGMYWTCTKAFRDKT